MTRNQISEALASVKSLLEVIAASEEWNAIASDDDTGEQETNMNDAIHYLAEIICNL
jgi:hypothetical protein